MKNKLDELLDKEIPLLIPVNILEDYSEVTDLNQRAKNRATSLRRCLEGSIKLFYRKKIIDNYVSEDEWNKLNLSRRIDLIGKHIDKEIACKFHEIRKIGNAGAHFDSHVNPSEVSQLVVIINELVENLLIKYFELYKFGSQPGVLTLLSSLPPVCRIKILEKVKANGYYINNLILIDKLAMAYLKNNEFEKSILFLKNAMDEEEILECNYHSLIEKMNLLNASINKLDIAKNVIDTARIFKILSTIGIGKEYEEFTHIFSVLVDGYKVEYTS